MTVFEIGNWKLRPIKKISEGGFGYIYLVASTSNPSMTFALKKIIAQNTEKIRSAQHELDFLKKYCIKGNTHFMSYEDSKVVRNSDGSSVFYILVEYCPTGTLFDLMNERFPSNAFFSESELLCIAKRIAEGLRELHRNGFTHYDLKIENLLFFDWQTIKLCDFGSVSKATADFAKLNSTESYAYESFFDSKTTMMYRPPEICDPYLKYKVDSKADMWMLGCILYTLMFFKHPFVEKSKLEISLAKFAWPSEPVYSENLENIVRNLLTPNPSLRPNAEELLDILSRSQKMKLNSLALNVKSQNMSVSKQLNLCRNRDQTRTSNLPQSFDFDFSSFDKKNAEKTNNFSFFKEREPEELSVNKVFNEDHYNGEGNSLFSFTEEVSLAHRHVKIFDSKKKLTTHKRFLEDKVIIDGFQGEGRKSFIGDNTEHRVKSYPVSLGSQINWLDFDAELKP